MHLIPGNLPGCHPSELGAPRLGLHCTSREVFTPQLRILSPYCGSHGSQRIACVISLNPVVSCEAGTVALHDDNTLFMDEDASPTKLTSLGIVYIPVSPAHSSTQ